mgnify:CR=1 FL=1
MRAHACLVSICRSSVCVRHLPARGCLFSPATICIITQGCLGIALRNVCDEAVHRRDGAESVSRVPGRRGTAMSGRHHESGHAAHRQCRVACSTPVHLLPAAAGTALGQPVPALPFIQLYAESSVQGGAPLPCCLAHHVPRATGALVPVSFGIASLRVMAWYNVLVMCGVCSWCYMRTAR